MPRCFSAKTTFTIPTMPAADSRCPTFVFAEPIGKGFAAPLATPSAWPMADASCGSPAAVPVPWASR